MCGACSRLNLPCEYPTPGLERKNRKRKQSASPEDEAENSKRKSIITNDKNDLSTTTTTATATAVTLTSPEVAAATDSTALVPTTAADVTPRSPPTAASPDVTSMHSGLFDLTELLSGESPTTQNFLSCLTGVGSPPSLVTSSPTPWYSLHLDSLGSQLFDYFRTRLAPQICVSNQECNSFLNVFVPMAQRDQAVLDSIVAWAGFHKDKGKHQDTGHFYLNRAIQSVKSKTREANDYTNLASILLICAGEICSGDVTHWDKHLSLAATIMHKQGGPSNFVHDNTLRWLASNFAYHDLLASSTTARNTHFPSSEYNEIMKHGFGLDALIGCCQPLFQILAEISDLAVLSQKLNQQGDTVTLEHLRELRSKAQTIEHKLECCHPDPLDMIALDAEQLQQQLSLFETFQLTARLHLRQSVLRMNPCSIEMQCLGKQLNDTLDQVLETKVEGGLVFPMFIAGIHSSTPESRDLHRVRFNKYYERNLARNIKRALMLLEEVWTRDELGSKHVDWYKIIQARGWDICFA